MIDETELLMLYRRKKRKKIIIISIIVVTIALISISGFLFTYKYMNFNYFNSEIKMNTDDYEFSNDVFRIASSASRDVDIEDLIKSYNKEYFELKVSDDKETKKCLKSLKNGTPGTYQANVILKNDYHTEKSVLKINIYDDIPPVLELSQEIIEINTNDSIDYKSYIIKAEDNIDELSAEDVIHNEINTAVSGSYVLNYVLQDKAGNETSRDIQVTVKQPVTVNSDTVADSPADESVNRKNVTSSPSDKKEKPSAENKFFSGNSIDSYNQALEYAEKNGKNGYEVKPTGEGFQVTLY